VNLAVEEEVSGFGPLHICSHLGLLDSATYLLSPSSSSSTSSSSSSLTSLPLDPNSWTSDGTRTALHICVESESESENKKRLLVLFLRKGGDPNLRDYNGRTPIEIAKEMKCSEDFALVFSSFSNPSSTPAVVDSDIPKKVISLHFFPFSSSSLDELALIVLVLVFVLLALLLPLTFTFHSLATGPSSSSQICRTL
jgi:hypothetical protein